MIGLKESLTTNVIPFQMTRALSSYLKRDMVIVTYQLPSQHRLDHEIMESSKKYDDNGVENVCSN